MEGLMGKLCLTDEEQKGIKIAWADSSKCGMVEPQALGKLLSEKPALADALANSVGNVWCPIKGVECKELVDNVFRFTFHQPAGKRWALEGGPWMFGGEALIMEDFVPTKTLPEYAFDSFPI